MKKTSVNHGMLLLFSRSVVSDSFVTPWTAACQGPLSMGFSSPEYWSGLPFPSPGDLPRPGIEPTSPALVGGFFTTEPPGKPLQCVGSQVIMLYTLNIYNLFDDYSSIKLKKIKRDTHGIPMNNCEFEPLVPPSLSEAGRLITQDTGSQR